MIVFHLPRPSICPAFTAIITQFFLISATLQPSRPAPNRRDSSRPGWNGMIFVPSSTTSGINLRYTLLIPYRRFVLVAINGVNKTSGTSSTAKGQSNVDLKGSKTRFLIIIRLFYLPLSETYFLIINRFFGRKNCFGSKNPGLIGFRAETKTLLSTMLLL